MGAGGFKTWFSYSKESIPHLFLLFIYLVYICFGAVIFGLLEREEEIIQTFELRRIETIIRSNITRLVESLSATPEDVFDLNRLVESLVETVSHPDWIPSRIELAQTSSDPWTFRSAALFSLTTLTTIGYGDIVPVTPCGRVFCVVYALFGVPMSFLLVADLGGVLARLSVRTARYVRRSLRKGKKGMYSAPALMRGMCRGSSNDGSEVTTDDVDVGGSEDHYEGTSEVEDDEYVVEEEYEVTEKPKEDLDSGKMLQIGERRTLLSGAFKEMNGNVIYDDSISSEGCEEIPKPKRIVSINAEDPDKTNDRSDPKPVKKRYKKIRIFKSKRKRRLHRGKSMVSKEYDEVPFPIILIFMLLYLIVGAAAFSFSEGWHYSESFYFVFITLTTIGFGDYTPKRHHINNTYIPCLFYTLLGLCYVSMCVTLLQKKFERLFQRLNRFLQCGIRKPST